VARRLEVPKMMLVVNKVLSSFDPASVRQEVEKSFNAKVGGVLPLTEDLIRLGSREVFVLRFPDHTWTQRVREIAAQIMA
jgi:MinD-like ATPase involved in chromosome partitioning or flagellar assembly